MAVRILLVLALVLPLAACGDDAPTPLRGTGLPSDFDPNDPEAASKILEQSFEKALEVELDDDAMLKLLSMHRKILAAGDDVRGAMAIGAGTAWNYHSYTKTLLKWHAMVDTTERGPRSARRELEKLDERLARLEKDLATAAGPEKQNLQQMLDLQRRMRPSLAKHVEIMKKLDTPAIKAFVAKWKPRFDAVEAEFDED